MLWRDHCILLSSVISSILRSTDEMLSAKCKFFAQLERNEMFWLPALTAFLPFLLMAEGGRLMTKSFSIFIMISDCTCREEALPQDINSLLSSVEFSLVFVLPLNDF